MSTDSVCDHVSSEMTAAPVIPKLPLLSFDGKAEHLAAAPDAKPAQEWCAESVTSSTTAEDTSKQWSDFSPNLSDVFYIDGAENKAEQKDTGGSSSSTTLDDTGGHNDLAVIGSPASIRFNVRNTFIDSISEPDDTVVVVRRSLSLPDLDAVVRAQVHSGFAGSHEDRNLMAAVARQMLSPMLFTVAEGERISRGSVGHPQVCNRPCEWLHKGHCRNGRDCNACHICASTGHKRSCVDKRDRKALSRMSYADRVQIFMPMLRAKAATWRFEANASCILTDLSVGTAVDCGWQASWQASASSCQVRKRLEEGFTHCTFGEILRHAFLTPVHPESPHVTVEELRRAYDALRASLR